MNSTLSINPSSFTTLNQPSSSLRPHNIRFSHKTLKKSFTFKAAATSNTAPNCASISPLKSAACAVIFAAAAFGKFPHSAARAEVSSPPETLIENLPSEDTQHEGKQDETNEHSPTTDLSESNSEEIEALKKLLGEKIEAGEDEESLSILKKLYSAQPENSDWKLLIAILLNDMGKTEEARKEFEEILSKNPLSFTALFESTLLMDRSGEGEAAMRRLEDTLRVAEEEKKLKEARDVKLIIAQLQFLHKNVEGALRSYEELEKEDPSDFRPYFCKGMVYRFLDKNVEASEQFAKYQEFSKKIEAEGHLRTPLSKMELFGTKGRELRLNFLSTLL